MAPLTTVFATVLFIAGSFALTLPRDAALAELSGRQAAVYVCGGPSCRTLTSRACSVCIKILRTVEVDVNGKSEPGRLQ